MFQLQRLCNLLLTQPHFQSIHVYRKFSRVLSSCQYQPIVSCKSTGIDIPDYAPFNTFCQISRHFRTSSTVHNGRNRTYGRRTFPDHRGTITPSNRPDGEFVSTNEEDKNILDDAEFATLVHGAEGLQAGVVGQVGLEGNVFVILPWIKWGPMKKTVTTEKLLLSEACALVNSLPHTEVVGQEVVKIRHESREVFGPGQILRLATKLRSIPNLSTVFVSIDVLHYKQIRALELEFGCRVVDRYWVVLSIFHQHAKTLEAKMQVALAELPYIRNRLSQESEKMMISKKTQQLESQLKKLSVQRDTVRSRRAKHGLPTVAVVGYTNTGKTTIIGALSGDASIEGRDKLFATLDVTAHPSRLPCGLSMLLLDTVGFIQDLPSALVASFNATLQDAACADVIVHVRDLSHPDRLLHHATVVSALYCIDLPPTTPIITLDNKADLVFEEPVLKSLDVLEGSATDLPPTLGCSFLNQDDKLKKFFQKEGDFSALQNLLGDDTATKSLEKERLKIMKREFEKVPSIVVSAKTKEGLLTASHAIETQLLRVTDKKIYRLTLPTGGEHIRILRNMADVAEENVVPDRPDRTQIISVMDNRQLSLFKNACKDINKNR